MAKQRYNYGDGGPLAAFPQNTITVEEARDWGSDASITDETISIPSTGLAELDYVPEGDLEIWTSTSKSGTQFTIVEDTPATDHEVQVNYANGYLTFYSGQYSTTAYATYTAACTTITKRQWDRIQREIEAVQTYLNGCAVRSNENLAKGACVQIVGYDSASSCPVVGGCAATSGNPPPTCVGVASTSAQIGEMLFAYSAGVIEVGASSFPANVRLAVGTDGKAAWPGKSTYPAPGDTFQVCGVGCGTAAYMVYVSPEVGRI